MQRTNIPNQQIFTNALKLNSKDNSTKKIKQAIQLGLLYQQYVAILRSSNMGIDKIGTGRDLYQQILAIENAS